MVSTPAEPSMMGCGDGRLGCRDCDDSGSGLRRVFEIRSLDNGRLYNLHVYIPRCPGESMSRVFESMRGVADQRSGCTVLRSSILELSSQWPVFWFPVASLDPARSGGRIGAIEVEETAAKAILHAWDLSSQDDCHARSRFRG